MKIQMFSLYNWSLLPQVEECKYLVVLLMSEGRMEGQINKQISAASAVFCPGLLWSMS